MAVYTSKIRATFSHLFRHFRQTTTHTICLPGDHR